MDVSESPDAVRLQQIRERYARGDLLGIGPDIRWALDYADRLTAELATRPPLAVEYGLMLRDGTVLTADSYEEREARAAQFEAAQWEITRLRREKRPADVYTWTEEPTL